MESTLAMSRKRAALERLHRARCIVSVVARSLGDGTATDDQHEAEGALLAAAELIMQAMTAFDKSPAELMTDTAHGAPDGSGDGNTKNEV